ncbi:MAG: hypothetical protein ABH986_06020, partial [archaeon]
MEKKKKKQTDVIVKFEHLNPRVQELIWSYEPLRIQETASMNPVKLSKTETQKFFNTKTIKGARRFRGLLESTTSLSALALAGTQTVANKLQTPINSTVWTIATVTGVLARANVVNNIKELHGKLMDSIKKNGLLQARFEGQYS